MNLIFPVTTLNVSVMYSSLQVAVDSPDEFECPEREADRFSLPDVRDHDNEEAFKAGQGFIYHQHVRKTGGTAFCDMASRQVEGLR